VERPPLGGGFPSTAPTSGRRLGNGSPSTRRIIREADKASVADLANNA